MTDAMTTAPTGDGPAEALSLEWMVPEDADELSNAREAVEALFAVAEGWTEMLGLELRASCVDRESFIQRSDVLPPRPCHLLVREPRPCAVSLDPTYRTIETGLTAIEREAVAAFVRQVLSQSCGDSTRYETCLGGMEVLASRTLVPAGWAEGDASSLDCYAGTVAIPIEHQDGRAWTCAPPSRHKVPQPVGLSVTNAEDRFRLSIDVYWSPWVGELERAGSPLFEGIARLESRGWSRT